MARILLFDTDYSLRILKARVFNGEVRIGKNRWVVDKARVLTLKGVFGTEPVYLLKWNTIYPIDWTVETDDVKRKMQSGEEMVIGVKRELVPLVPKFEKGVTPDLLGSIIDVGFLKNMKHYSEEGKRGLPENIFPIIIFVIIMAVLGFLLSYGVQMGWFKQILGI